MFAAFGHGDTSQFIGMYYFHFPRLSVQYLLQGTLGHTIRHQGEYRLVRDYFMLGSDDGQQYAVQRGRPMRVIVSFADVSKCM